MNLIKSFLNRLIRRYRAEIERDKFRRAGKKLREKGPPACSLILRTRACNPFIPVLSHWADWSIGEYGFVGNTLKQPYIVYVKADMLCLSQFFESYLPLISSNSRIVLLTAGGDWTLPKQTDLRSPSYQVTGFDKKLLRLSADERILHWYAENLDTYCEKISPIPLGYIGADGDELYRSILDQDQSIAISEKPFKALCAHRIRHGPQWQLRRNVRDLAVGSWSELVDYRDQIPETEFFGTVQRYPFVICVGGGGLDPSPKAWVSLLAGAIPIVERNPTTMGYRDLPVVFVDTWDENTISSERMRSWLDQFSAWFEDPSLRRQVLERMSMGHWLRKIYQHFDEFDPTAAARLRRSRCSLTACQ